MNALLDALSDDPAPRRRRWAAAGVVAVLLGGGIWGMAAALRADAATCRGAEQKLVGVWDDEQRAAVEHAILATKLSYAPDTWSRVEAHLDTYAKAWVAARTEACEATRVGEQSDQLLDLRMACLDQRREHLAATVEELAGADAGVVEQAVTLALSLPSLDPCADASALLAATPPPEDPADAERVASLDEQLLLAQAKQDAGNYEAALRMVDPVVEAARELEYEPLLARALLRQGMLRNSIGQLDGSVLALRQALDAAVAQRMLEEAAQASAGLSFVVGVKQSRHEAGREWAAHADSFSRAGGTSELRATYLDNLGLIAWSEGKYPEARGHLERALDLREQTFGPEHRLVASTLRNLGNVAQDEGNHAEARRHLERALAITQGMLGPEHPEVANALHTLAIVAWSQGKYDEARSTNERVLAIRERALGPEHPLVATALNNLGNMAASEGQLAQARTYYERAIAIREKVLGPQHRQVATSLTSLGNLAYEERDFDEARAKFERAIGIIEATVGLEHPDMGRALANLGNIDKALGRNEDAIASYDRALAIWTAALGPDHPLVCAVTADRAESMVALGRAEEVLGDLERALTNSLASGGDPLTLANVRFALASALWEAPVGRGRDRPRARQLAESARAGIAETGQAARRVEEIDAWLAGHVE